MAAASEPGRERPGGRGPGGQPLLAARGLRFSRGGRQVLRGIDLDLEPGLCVGVLGPNGSGKTTLLDLCCGLLAPESGEVRVLGRPLGRWSRRALARHLALVPQDFALRFGFTVREVVLMGRHPHLGRLADPGPRDLELAEKAMAELDLEDLAGRRVTALSGGEKQRVAVARALAQEPDILLLDEATSNLDIYHALAILGAIRQQARQRGMAVAAAMHDLNLAAWFCDRLVVLHRGKIAAQGTVAQVLRPELIRQVYGVEARVGPDAFGAGLLVSFQGIG